MFKLFVIIGITFFNLLGANENSSIDQGLICSKNIEKESRHILFKNLVEQEFRVKSGRLETFMDCCKAGIIELRDGKIHVQSNRFSMIQNEMAFLSDTLEWIPVSESLREILGVATIEVFLEECKIKGVCPKQHVGFYWSPTWDLWFCLNDCYYNFYKNFPNGKGE